MNIIRFVEPTNNSPYYCKKDLFKILDGDEIVIIHPDGSKETKKCKYIGPYHVKIGSDIWHICEFASKMKKFGKKYYPKINRQVYLRDVRPVKPIDLYVYDWILYHYVNKHITDCVFEAEDDGVLDIFEVAYTDERANVVVYIGEREEAVKSAKAYCEEHNLIFVEEDD